MIQRSGKDGYTSYTKYNPDGPRFFEIRDLFDICILQILKLMGVPIQRGRLAWDIIR